MIKTDTKNVNEAIERLSDAALVGDNTNCTVIKNDLATVLLAYQIELNNNAEKVERSKKDDVEQRIVGMEMVVENFGHEHGLNREFELTPDQIYNLCDDIYGGDSQHVRGKHQSEAVS